MGGKTIVVLGSCSVDFTTYAPRLPKPGETLTGSKFLTSFGGKGANQCVSASKLGAKTALIASIGDDSWGKDYRKYLTDLGIDTTHTKQKNNVGTGIAQIMVSGSGENQIIIVAGANNTLSIDDAEVKNQIVNADILVCQLETPLGTTLEAFQLCKGIKILNAAPGRNDIDEILKHTTILCVNESEASILTSRKVENMNDAAIAIEELVKKVSTVIITMGKEGAIYITKEDNMVYHVECEAVKPVDTTGAGDAFIGALSMLLATEPSKDLHQIIGASCRVATLSVTKEGTQTSYEKVDGLFDKTYKYKHYGILQPNRRKENK